MQWYHIPLGIIGWLAGLAIFGILTDVHQNRLQGI
jgi:hypothetical protein